MNLKFILYLYYIINSIALISLKKIRAAKSDPKGDGGFVSLKNLAIGDISPISLILLTYKFKIYTIQKNFL